MNRREPVHALCVEGVRKSFRNDLTLAKREVLRGISFTASGGEALGFLGPNGAGKTTTIKIILGLIRADAGAATIFGRPAGSREAAQRIGYLPETPYFHPQLSLGEFLSFCGRMSGVPARELRHRIDAIVGTVGLEAHRDRRLKTFSKGMIQRAGLAQAILHDPDLLVLDEPFSGLDPVGRRMVRDVLVGLKGKGKTVFFSSHILPDMEALCDRVCIIREGIISKVLCLDDLMRLGEGMVEITARGVRPGSLGALREHVVSAGERGNETFIVVREQRFVRAVIEHLYERDAEVLKVANERRSLEDLFMREISPPDAGAGTPAAKPEPQEEPKVFAGF